MEIQNISGVDNMPVNKLQDNPEPENRQEQQRVEVNEEKPAIDPSKGQNVDTLS